MIKAVIFDIGGVVASPATFHLLAKKYAKALKLVDVDVYGVLEKYWHLWEVERINEREFFESVARDLSRESDKDKIKEMMYGFAKPRKGIFSLIKKLRKRYKIFALTNHAREFFEFIDKKYGIERNFDAVFTSYEARLAKPDSGFFRHMLKETGMKPEECIFIDDSEKNVKAAGMLGFKAILHRSLKQTEKEFRKVGVNF